MEDVISADDDQAAAAAEPAPEEVEATGAAAVAELARLGVEALLPPAFPAIHVGHNERGEVNAVKVVVSEALRSAALELEFLAEVDRTFVEPEPKFSAALATLRSPRRFVVLRSRPGSGTRTAAVAMLQRLVKDDSRLRPHHLGLGGRNRFPTAALGSAKHQAYLMDLPIDDEDFKVSPKFGGELMAASQTLLAAGSYLIVITDAEQWARIGGYVQDSLVHDLQAPGAESVGRHWLAVNVPGYDFDPWFKDPKIAGLLDGSTPREAVETAKLIRTAIAPDFNPSFTAADLNLTPGAEGTDLQLRIASVAATRGNWRSELLAWHKTPGRTAFERNFLLVTAVLRGFPVRLAYKEAKQLCAKFGDAVESVSGHSGPGVIELLDTIRADAGHDDSVRFSRPRWAEAILDYYWRDRPDDHDKFIDWLTRLPQSSTFEPEDRAALTERVFEVLFDLIMTRDRLDKLGDVVDAWSSREESTAFAWSLLDAASLHPRVGRDVHQLMLRWSKAPTGFQRRRAVAAVCGLEFGRLHTEKALVRLKHAADSDDPVVVEEVERAVLALWKEPAVARVLLKRVTGWASDETAKHVMAARNIFAAVAGLPSPTDSTRPDLLVRAMSSEEDMKLVSEGWRCLLVSAMDSADLGRALHPWFEAGQSAPAVADDVESVLERAVAGELRPKERLEKCLNRWLGLTGALDTSPAGRFAQKIGRITAQAPDMPAAPTVPDEADADV